MSQTYPEIDQTFIDHFSKKEDQFFRRLMQRIFIENETEIDLDQAMQIDVVKRIISAIKNDTKVVPFTRSMSEKTLEKLHHSLDESQRCRFFVYVQETKMLTQFYQTYKPEFQKRLLLYLYHQNSEKHAFFSAKSATMNRLDAVYIEQKSLLKTESDRMVNQFLDRLQNPKIPLSSIQKETLALFKNEDWVDIEIFFKALISEYESLNLKILDRDSFTIYLNLMHVLAITYPKLPYLLTEMRTLFEHLIELLLEMKTGEWLIKILDQIPSGFQDAFIDFYIQEAGGVDMSDGSHIAILLQRIQHVPECKEHPFLDIIRV